MKNQIDMNYICKLDFSPRFEPALTAENEIKEETTGHMKNNNNNILSNKMTIKSIIDAQAAYEAPACETLAIEEGCAMCATSGNGEIDPATGIDWGEI